MRFSLTGWRAEFVAAQILLQFAFFPLALLMGAWNNWPAREALAYWAFCTLSGAAIHGLALASAALARRIRRRGSRDG